MRLQSIVAGCVVATLSASLTAPPATADNTTGPASGNSLATASTVLPGRAAPGSTPERKAAWASLNPEQQQRVRDLFTARVAPEIRSAAAAGQSARPVRDLLAGKETHGPADNALRTVAQPLKPSAAVAGFDDDTDGLPDAFENGVADAFTPFYHISAGELPGTGFAIHADGVPQTSIVPLPAIPPKSDFRVQPLGFASDGFTQFGFLRIDYLSLWNRDDGLDLGCVSSTILDLVGIPVGDVIRALSGHPEEQERSAVLVAAPVPAPGTFNTDPAAYSAYDFFTTAHEGVSIFDQSMFLAPSAPVPAGNHIQLANARSKHGTYAFNPDGYPIFHPAVVAAAYSTIDFLFFAEIIDEITYLALLFLADDLFFLCVVEHFQEQGGSFAGRRTNVGEPGRPINQSGFIEDPKVRAKLTTPLWIL
jgi:hypothetical protein